MVITQVVPPVYGFYSLSPTTAVQLYSDFPPPRPRNCSVTVLPDKHRGSRSSPRLASSTVMPPAGSGTGWRSPFVQPRGVGVPTEKRDMKCPFEQCDSPVCLMEVNFLLSERSAILPLSQSWDRAVELNREVTSSIPG
ncbi:hypothetical protein J6590_014585 [Homalodisca vitripennis]|nr:hypothetical protein J6590_014585 [Homalodisca vitripennis]